MPGFLLTNAPQSTTEAIIGQYLAVLRSDPAIQAAGVTVLGLEGDRRTLPPNMPEVAQLPCIRVGRPKVTGTWFEEGGHRMEMHLPIELIYLGHHYVDECRMIELWARATLPVDEPRRSSVADMFHEHDGLGIHNVTLATTAGDTSEVGDDRFAQVVLGAVVITFEFNT